MTRFLADASTLIALASCGHLDALKSITHQVHATSPVVEEVLKDRPGSAAIREGLQAGWIKEIPGSGDIAGLGRGEAATILAARKNDVLILDDRAARLEARSRAIKLTGLLGLLVHGVNLRAITPIEGMQILDALARGPFRMSAELYAWACQEMEQ